MTATVLADGRIVVVGASLPGTQVSRVVRLLPDGTLDPAFEYSSEYLGPESEIQQDGKIVLSNPAVVRLLPDGRVDDGFNPSGGGGAHVALQPDGKILLSGGYSMSVNGGARRFFARLHPDGTLDTSLPQINTILLDTATQPDGKIVIAGNFTMVHGVARQNLARLLPDGSLDIAFSPNPSNSIYSLTLLPDGKILAGGGVGAIGSIGGTSRDWIARLHPNGTVDAGFNFTTNNPGGYTVNWVPQADGKLIIVGSFTTVNGVSRNRFARLHSNGTLDTTFNSPGVNDEVRSAVLQPDGKVIIVGTFTVVGGQPRPNFARLENDPATQSLTAPDSTWVQWLRGGASPEVGEVRFDLSTDDGTTWSPLGPGTRIAGGWALTGLNLPASGLIRARARSLVGNYNGGSGLVETVTALGAGASFRITRVLLEVGNLLVSFPSEIGRSYTLWQSDSMAEGTWTDTGVPALNGTGAILTFRAPAAIPGRRYFRVRAGP